MANYWYVVKEVIKDADILLLVLDARLINETRNYEIEEKVRLNDKPIIYVISKCDLVDKTFLEKKKKELSPCVFISAREHQGTAILRERILIEARKAYPDKNMVTVGVLGYPNVGKSSLINAMKGKKAARTSILSGYTKGVQKIRSSRITFLDTPGVIPYMEKDYLKHAFIGTIDFTKAKEPDLIAMELMLAFPGQIEAFYGVEVKEDKEETLEEIAMDKKVLKKGGIADIDRASRMILKDWQKGIIPPL